VNTKVEPAATLPGHMITKRIGSQNSSLLLAPRPA